MPRLLAVLALLVPGPAAAQQVRVDLSPQPGRSRSSDSHWRAYLATTCADRRVEGELVVQSDRYVRVHQLSTPVRVAPGTCTETLVWVPGNRDALGVTVVDPSGEVLARGGWMNGRAARLPQVAVLDRSGVLEQLLRRSGRSIEIVRFVALEQDHPGGGIAALLLARHDELATLREPERRAIDAWVELGGHLLITSEPARHDVLLPPGGARQDRRGLGTITTLEEGSGLHVALERHLDDLLDIGVPPQSMEAEDATFFYGPIHAAVDENARTRPPLPLVAVVLGLTLLLIGPLPFAWLSRRGKPILGLAMVPGIVAASFGALVAIGYARKGTSARFNAVTVLQADSGGRWAEARRNVGLFVTRPGPVTVRGAKGALLRQIFDTSGGARRTRTRIEDQRLTLERIPAGLWETVYLREDSVRSLGRGVLVRNEGGGVVIENGTSWPIRDAGLMYLSALAMRPLGTLAPGERRHIAFGTWPSVPMPPEWDLTDVQGKVGFPILIGRIDEPVLPGFAGFRRGHELTLLQVVGQ